MTRKRRKREDDAEDAAAERSRQRLYEAITSHIEDAAPAKRRDYVGEALERMLSRGYRNGDEYDDGGAS